MGVVWTTRPRATIVAVVLLAVLAFALSLKPTYRAQSAESVHVLCGQQECYIFINVTHQGWTGSYLTDIGAVMRQSLHGAVYPSHRKRETVVFRVTSESQVRYPFAGEATLTNRENFAKQMLQPMPEVYLNIGVDRPKHDVSASIGGKKVVFSLQGNPLSGESLVVIRDDRSENLWSLNRKVRQTTSSEYESLFR